MEYFKPTDNAEEACEKFWDMSGPWPVPRKEIKCPCCGKKTLTLRDIWFHAARWSKRPCRCTISFKCMTCSFVPTFGVIVPKEMVYEIHGGFKQYKYREAKRFLAEYNKKKGVENEQNR